MQKRAHVHVQFCSIYDDRNINWQWAILHINFNFLKSIHSQ